MQAINKSYKDHPNIRQIKDMRNLCNSETDKGSSVRLVQKMLKTAEGIDPILPKLVKLADTHFSKILMLQILCTTKPFFLTALKFQI